MGCQTTKNKLQRIKMHKQPTLKIQTEKILCENVLDSVFGRVGEERPA